MKILITVAFCLIGLKGLNAQTQIENCIYQEIPKSEIKYVHPVYKIDVNYFFEKSTKKAYALVSWQLETEKTRLCFDQGMDKFPESKLLIPTVSVSQVQIKVLGQDNFVNLDVFPSANGHWSSSTQMVSIPYSSQSLIVHAIENKIPTVEFNGDPRMRITITERKPITQFKCTDKEEEAGVLNLFKNLRKVKVKAESMIRFGVNSEEAMEDFLKKCVQFKSVNAESFGEFDKEQKIYSKIKKGEFNFIGNSKKETYEKMKGFLFENASIHNI
jgi:hypothetical protein